MSIESSQTVAQASIHQQIMNSSEEDQIPVSTEEVLSETGENSAVQVQHENERMTTISPMPMDLSESVTTAEAITPSTSSEGISVGTQSMTDVQTLASVENEDQENATDLQLNGGNGEPSSPHTSSLAEIGITVLPQTQDTLGIDSQEGGIMSSDSAVAVTVADTVSVLSQSQLPLVPTNLPPWAGRLRDCERIGDSYRGYVTNEVELDLILTLHKQHTSTCWGTRQSPSSAKPSIRLMWRSQYVPYDGIPFLNTGRRATVMECQYGPRRKGNINKKQVFQEDAGLISVKKLHRPTCPARIYIKKVRKFPEFRIDPNLEGKNVRQAQERALTALRLAGIETGGEERFYVQLPLPIAHEYHDVDDIPIITPGLDGSPSQRLDPKVVDKVQELVARGVTGIYTVKHCLKEFVEKELFVGQDCPPRHNKAFFPTIIDIQNHIHTAQMALATGTLLPLPPLTNLPVLASQSKDRSSRKRKAVTGKQFQGSQTQFQTAQAIASLQESENATISHQQDQVSEDILQSERQQQQPEYHQQFAEQIQQVQVTTVNTDQPQIVITQNPTVGRQDGQVVIVVTNNNMYTGQAEGDIPTTLSLGTLQPSQISSLASVSFETPSSGGQTVAYLPQTLDSNIQLPAQDGYNISQPQAGSILTVLDPRVTNASTSALGSVTPTEAVQLQVMSASNNSSQSATPATVINVANALAEASRVSPSQLTLQSDTDPVTADQTEPAAKRSRTVVLDLASLVKEAVFDTQQEVPPNAQVTTIGQNTSTTSMPCQQQTEHLPAHAQPISQLVTMEAEPSTIVSNQPNTTIPTEDDVRGDVEAVGETSTGISNESNSSDHSISESPLVVSEKANEEKSINFSSDDTRTDQLVAMTIKGKEEMEDALADSRTAKAEESEDLIAVPQEVQPIAFLSNPIQQESLNYTQEKQVLDTSSDAADFIKSENLQQDLQTSFQQHSSEQQELTGTNDTADQEQTESSSTETPELTR